MKRLIKKASSETREYKISGGPVFLDKLEDLLRTIEGLSMDGCSRSMNVFIDGDGGVNLKFKKLNPNKKTYKYEKLEYNYDKEYYNEEEDKYYFHIL
jgi:Zn-finger nucleic acid-binding protein